MNCCESSKLGCVQPFPKPPKPRPLGDEPPVKVCAEGAYNLIRRIGVGSFGDVYLGRCVDSGMEVAIKLEPAETKHHQLTKEAHVYTALTGINGVPKMHWFGVTGDWSIMVLDLLGPSLDNLFHSCGRRFSLETVCMLGIQLVSCLERLHLNCYLHRDIKPHNFMVGRGENADQVYMIDFGLAKRYCESHTRKHIKERESNKLCGTARFASINMHNGLEQSRRDDLEALGYMLVYFALGRLPWQGLKISDKHQLHREIGKLKKADTIESLCKGLPQECADYLHYCRSLRFEQDPDYVKLRQFWKDVLLRTDVQRTATFDWMHLNEELNEIGMRLTGSKLGSRASRANSLVVVEVEDEEAEGSEENGQDEGIDCVEWQGDTQPQSQSSFWRCWVCSS